MRRLWRTCVAAMVLAGPGMGGAASAACVLQGTVTADGLPHGGAAVSVIRAGGEIARTRSGEDGRYRVEFPEFPPRLRAIEVVVAAEGFAEDRRLFFRGDGDCPNARDNDVDLAPAAGDISDFSSLGLTLYVAPYQLYGEGAEAVASRFNSDLPRMVHHRILAYKSALEAPTANVDISVNGLRESLTAAEGERIRRLGHRLNALGIIAGDGELTPGEGGDRAIEMVSVFRTIPAYGDLRLLMQPISDRIPARHASPSRLAEALHDLWGKQAVISYVLQRLATHEGPWQRDELIRLQDILIGVRKTMTADDPLLQPVQGLLAAIDGVLAP